ncbi:MAG: sugar transferase [Bacteroidales bacterium]|nr:sugar transferase [Bacteroidales bacterium]
MAVINKKKQTFRHVACDALAAILATAVFFAGRKYEFFGASGWRQVFEQTVHDWKFYVDITLIPCFWLLFYALCGSYRKIYRKSRLKELVSTIRQVLIGVLILFFVIMLDDYIRRPQDYIRFFLLLFFLQFGLTYLFRLIIISITNRQIHRGELEFPTILVGGGQEALRYYHALQNQRQHSGTKLLGFVTANGENTTEISALLPCMGTYEDIPELIRKHKVEEMVVAVGDDTRLILGKIFPNLEASNLLIKIFPHTTDYLIGLVNSTAVYHEPLIEMQLDFMPIGQKICKRIFDVIGSLLCMLLCVPLYIFLAFGVKCSSPGPVLFRQERVGFRGKPFNIIKFRSMYVDAEEAGPQLSSQHDSRITHFGVFIRKTHLDEIPQFFNVLKGDMSLVGPRPERQYYIDQIVKKAPHYRLLQLIKPGLTSWGQVTYGYAENVDEMIERLRYDMVYLENMSLLMDVKILCYTVLAVIAHKGK